MKELLFAMIGAGFWARYQLAGWHELPGVRCVAIADRDLAKAKALAEAFGISAAYGDAVTLLDAEAVDFVDVVTDVHSHSEFACLAADRGLPVVVQKPLAPTLAEAEDLVFHCAEARVRLLVNENWRWQTPIRAVKAILNDGVIGDVFRGRIDMISGFPVFDNQPFLRDLEQFIITDLGCHTLDVARFWFGEFNRLYAETQRVHPDIAGEDVATIVLRNPTTTVTVNMAYAGTPLEREAFPETFAFIEGSRGSIELAKDYWVRVTTAEGTHARRHAPPRYPWANPAYDVVHASIVDAQRNLAEALRGDASAETTGEDNLRTLRLVFGAYESARDLRVVSL